MNSVAYDFVHPEEFNSFVPEVVIEKRSQNAELILLIITAAIILAASSHFYLQWRENHQE